ncbi:MAG: FAD-binding protein [Coriobacteriia bacterium]|nr:FAD-binding protein [Coriobacteriia bacterium]
MKEREGIESTTEENGKGISRRALLSGAAVVTAGAALSGLIACTTGTPAPEPAKEPEGTAPVTPPAGPEAATGPKWSWETKPDPIPEAEIKEVFETEIAVVGAGVAGMAVAWWGSKKGAQIHVIEKMDKPSTRSNQIAGVNTYLQKELGMPDFPINEILQYTKAFQGGFVNMGLLKQFLYNSGRMWDEVAAAAIEDGHTPIYLDRGNESGVYTVDTPLYKEYRTMANIYPSNELMCERFKADAEAAGTVFHFDSPAEQLVTEGGKVVGVIAKGPDGYFRVNASKGVVVSTGDYSGDPEMLERWGGVAKWADFLMYSPAGANTGDGLKMMLWAGASMQPCEEHAPMIHCLMGAFSNPNPWLRINIRGERYENEDVPNAQVCYGRFLQPGNKAWCVFDDNFGEDSLKHTNGFGRERFNPDSTPDRIKGQLESGALVKADTIEELAAAIEVPADALKKTVDRYNVLCAAGDDKDFGKDPVNLLPIVKGPFYAAPIAAPILCMVGGINIDDRYRVLAEDGTIIENLYSIGNASGNYYAVDYPTIMAGQSHGRCLTAGMVLGEALAEGRSVEPIIA